ncbi:dual specificity tyrosine-phosphorylation-regulated kinase 4-like [Solea senegalensis]|uniref:Dual specificity tyrosine-phosphorylation-regulated kinase 4-like n=1 Tax=Solea senegalensis TaxID=28829 RepID=A0AAV6QCR7_SOLSE|nr:dual specificity tyrosine-phosphorylation-regulated kinase 4-like [Solea senegalensis]
MDCCCSETRGSSIVTLNRKTYFSSKRTVKCTQLSVTLGGATFWKTPVSEYWNFLKIFLAFTCSRNTYTLLCPTSSSSTDPEFTFTPMYASPEVLLGKSCSPATDMWSLGCIIAELHLGYPLFCGSNSEQQFIRIMQVLGPPPKELLVNAPKKKNYFDCKGVPLRMESVMRYRTSLTRHLASTNYHFVDFIRRCLEYDPQRRMTPEEAMHHPWILQGVNNNKSARRTDVPASASYTRPALLRRKKLSHQQLQPVVEVEARTFHKPYHNVFQHNSLLVDCY